MKKKTIKGPGKKKYSQDVIRLMEMVNDMGHIPVTRFGGLGATKKALNVEQNNRNSRSNRKRKKFHGR